MSDATMVGDAMMLLLETIAAKIDTRAADADAAAEAIWPPQAGCCVRREAKTLRECAAMIRATTATVSPRGLRLV